MQRMWRSVTLRALLLFDRLLLGLDALDLAAGGEALVTQNAQLLDFGLLPAVFAEFEHLDVARAWLAVFIDRLFFGYLWAPQHDELANVLDWRSIQLVSELAVNGFAVSAVVAENTNFDQTVRIKRQVDFFLHSGGQAIAANQDHRVEMVGFSAVFAALGGGELYLGHTRIIVGSRSKHESK